MNNIGFCYVDGISTENTPHFATLAAQRQFFESKIVATLEDGFYVPHYQDMLTISNSDLNFNTKVNYVAILFSGKYYYYFIDSVAYVSETDIEVSISLDTVQTFLFDIIVHDSIIERRFINRWVYNPLYQDYSINRNYIQENLSDSNFLPYKYNYDENLFEGQAMAVAIKTRIAGAEGDTRFSSVKTYTIDLGANMRVTYQDFASISFYPIVTDEDNALIPISYQGDASFGYINSLWAIEAAAVAETTYAIHYFPFNPLPDVEIVNDVWSFPNDPYVPTYEPAYYGLYNSKKVIQNFTYKHSEYDYDSDHTEISNIKSVNIEHTWKIADKGRPLYDNKGVMFRRNTSIAEPYSTCYMTQMLDANYMSLQFGEGQNMASLNLFRIDVTYVSLLYAGDLISGNRYYAIVPDGQSAFYFNLDNYTVCDPIAYTTLGVDRYGEWARNNAYTVGMAGVKVAIETVGASVLAAFKVGSAQNKIGAILKDKSSYDKRHKIPTLKKRFAAKIRDLKDEQALAGLKGGVDAASGASGILGTITTQANLSKAPNSIKSFGTAGANMLAGGVPVYYVNYVNDFDQVAYYYHQYGFLVNKPFKTVAYSNPFNELVSRYYFDYYKFQYVDIDLRVMCTSDMIADLVERLESGIRVWYIDHGDMCDYQYDNVERSYING